MITPGAFPRYDHHPLHRWFGEGAVQDLRRVNGKFRACILGSFMKYGEGAKDFATFEEAAAELVKMHDRLFEHLVWC